MKASEITKESLKIASEVCIYTNDSISTEVLSLEDNALNMDINEILLTPRETVSELDKYIVGQAEAKKAVSIALRNRWRRQKVSTLLKDEISPKNILMIGPTGVGKTEIARRLAISNAPFIKTKHRNLPKLGM